jgi:hypothetical protein
MTVKLGQKLPGEKGGEVVRCHDVTASSFVAEVLDKVFAHFHTVAIKYHIGSSPVLV